MDLHVLECLEHDLTISGKCLSVSLSLCVCDKNFVASVAEELIVRISLKLIFSVILMKICVYQVLLKIALQGTKVALFSEFWE